MYKYKFLSTISTISFQTSEKTRNILSDHRKVTKYMPNPNSNTSFYDLVFYHILSGYTENEKSLKLALDKLLTPYNNILSSSIFNEIKTIGPYYNKNVTNKAHSLYVLQFYRKIRSSSLFPFKIQDNKQKVPRSLYPEIKTEEIKYESSLEYLYNKITHGNIPGKNSDFFLFSYGTPDNIDKKVSYTFNALSEHNLDLVMFHPLENKPLYQRKPESILSFAVRKGFLVNNINRVNIQHPLMLLATLFEKANQKKSHKIISFSSAPTGKTSSKEGPSIAPYIPDRLATRICAEILSFKHPEHFKELLKEVPVLNKARALITKENTNQINKPLINIIPHSNHYDILMITDFRIRGGGVKSVITEANILKEAGYKVGIMHLDAVTLKPYSNFFAPEALNNCLKNQIPITNGLSYINTQFSIVRYPPTLISLPFRYPDIKTKKSAIVVNQPPKRMTTDIPFYKPLQCHQHARKLFSTEPEWWPNGPEARASMQNYTNKIPLSREDWLNVINNFAKDHEIELRVERGKQENNPIILGRHSRDVINKWPADSQTLLQVYPSTNEFSVCILGGANRPFQVLNNYPSNWKVWEFGELDVQEYLRMLDFFVFFPHENRIEPMARCIIEAMAAGIPVILPSRFKYIYGYSPMYCEPENVIDTMLNFKNDIDKYRNKCYETKDEAKKLYGPQILINRLNKLNVYPTES